MNKLLFIMKPSSWGSGATGRRESMREHLEAVFGGGKKEGVEGGEGSRHSKWPGWEIKVGWGLEDALLSSMARYRVPYPSQTGRPSSGTQLKGWFGCGAGLRESSRLFLPLSSCEPLKRCW